MHGGAAGRAPSRASRSCQEAVILDQIARHHSSGGNLLALHPTVKPVAMVANAILDCSARSDIVLDAFLGSGTTIIAAERIGRRCYGLELEGLYVDTIVHRWQALTGEMACHAASGRSFDDLARQAKAGLATIIKRRSLDAVPVGFIQTSASRTRGSGGSFSLTLLIAVDRVGLLHRCQR
jgi:DNA methylase